VQEKTMTSRKTVSLALGSGSSRGWAHIGVIEALEEADIPIDYIVGSSTGSYVGALYACGSLQSLKEFVLKMDGKKVFSYFDVVFPRSGLLDGTRRLKELLHRESSTPDILETVMTSINIMQERITRTNLAVEPPDILIQPRLGQLKMMDFDQVEQTIKEGYLGVKEKIEDIKKLLEPN
jgi:NTE family protein